LFVQIRSEMQNAWRFIRWPFECKVGGIQPWPDGLRQNRESPPKAFGESCNCASHTGCRRIVNIASVAAALAACSEPRQTNKQTKQTNKPTNEKTNQQTNTHTI
jgi:hypothetical protein